MTGTPLGYGGGYKTKILLKGEFIMTNTKKKNGNKRKLLGAVGMLTVSAAMLVSSTFAWFSMNKTVRAQTMSISAKSDSTFLLISKTNTDAADIQTEKKTLVDDLATGVTNTTLIPSTPAVAADLTTYATPLTGANAVTNQATAAVQSNWWTANSDDPAKATENTINVTKLTAANFSDYVIKKTVYLTVAKGANNAINLSVTPTFAKTGTDDQTDYTGVKVLVATSDGGFATLTKDSAKTDIKGSNTALTDATVLTVDLYIYYDGKDSTVYSNNYGKLAGADVTFEFEVEPVTT